MVASKQLRLAVETQEERRARLENDAGTKRLRLAMETDKEKKAMALETEEEKEEQKRNGFDLDLWIEIGV